MNRGAVFFTALLIILSGCAGSDAPSNVDGTTETRTPTTDGPTPTPRESVSTGTETTARRATPESPTPVPIQNPWGKEPIVIGINQSIDPNRNYTEQVVRAVNYWDENGNGHTDWDPAFVVRPDERSPDVEIRFVNEIEQCGLNSSGPTIGCAPVLSADSTARRTEVVQVNVGLTNESAYRVIRHELGHVLGLEHDEGPDDVMAPYDRVYDQIIRVHVEFETTATHERRDTRRQVWYALEYYSNGADGHVDEEIDFAEIEERSTADVVVEVNREGSESRASIVGSQVVIEVNGIPVDRRGWHIGYWLGFYFGAGSDSELPPPFDEPDSDPRVGWWR